MGFKARVPLSLSWGDGRGRHTCHSAAEETVAECSFPPALSSAVRQRVLDGLLKGLQATRKAIRERTFR